MSQLNAIALLFHPSGDGRILTASVRNGPDNLGLPGGKVEVGETCFNAAVRELYEETGVRWSGQEFGAESDPVFVGSDRSDTLRPGTTLAYWIRKWKGKPRSRETGVYVRWATVEEIVAPHNRYAPYNRAMFRALGLDQDD